MNSSSFKVVTGLLVAAAIAIALIAIPQGRGKKPKHHGHPGQGGKQAAQIDATFFGALAAAPDPELRPDAPKQMIALGALGADFVLVAPLEVVDLGTRVQLTGQLQSSSDPQAALRLFIKLEDPTAKGFSQSLVKSAYAPQGSVDPSTWRGFGSASGALVGLGSLDGQQFLIREQKDAIAQLGPGANDVNGELGLLVPLRVKPAFGGEDAGKDNGKGKGKGKGDDDDGDPGVLTLDLPAGYLCAAPAVNDPAVQPAAAGHALTLFGFAPELVFVAGGALRETPDGHARLTGVVASADQPDARFWVDFTYGGRTSPGMDGHPPKHSPKRELNKAAYTDNGGPVHPQDWRYYTEATGALIGLGDWAGARYAVEGHGPAFQVGFGANGKNLAYGASGWFEARLEAGPNKGSLPAELEGDVNIDLDLGCRACAGEAPVAKGLAGTGGHALWLPPVGEDFAVVGGGTWSVRPDGDLAFDAVVARKSDPEQAFVLAMRASGLVPAGEEPPGSPKLELAASAYAKNGGPIDPATWNYWTTVEGTLFGLGAFDGARLAFERTGPALQVGLGANGKNLAYGAATWIAVDVIAQPNEGDPLPSKTMQGDLNLDLGSDCFACVDSVLRQRGATVMERAFVIPGIAEFLQFEAGGQLVEHADGSAALSGVVRDAVNGRRFVVDLVFAERIDPGHADYPPPGSPYLRALDPFSHVDAGGPIDPGTWHYYRELSGELRGLDALLGARLAASERGPALQVGFGATGKELVWGASCWFELETVAQPHNGPGLQVAAVGDMGLDLGGDCRECPLPAIPSNGAAHALWLPSVASDFAFLPGASFEERSDGSARLVGHAASVSQPGKQFAVDVTFSERVIPGALGHPPADSPKLELASDSYVANGGPIDPASWRYYLNTEGTLEGHGLLAGARIALERAGPAFQVGPGASGKNTGPGASGWLATTLLKQPTTGNSLPQNLGMGDFNLDFRNDCVDCASATQSDGYSVTTTGFAFWATELGQDFVFQPAGTLTELPNGDLHLTGRLVRTSNPSEGFDVKLELSGVIRPGDPNHPPVGSPKLELAPAAYVAAGGPVDPSTWTYYTQVSGLLIGHGAWAGARYSLSPEGAAFQVGVGANGKNAGFGLSGWLDTTLVQSAPGVDLPASTTRADFNLDLGCE